LNPSSLIMSSHGHGAPRSETVKVVFRVRPLSKQEVADGRQVITVANLKENCVEIRLPASTSNSSTSDNGQSSSSGEQRVVYPFDAVFDTRVSQKEIYETCAAPVVQSVLEGYNGTIFCYGQTGAGKTHTMEGNLDDSDQIGERGIIPNAFQHIFDHVAASEKAASSGDGDDVDGGADQTTDNADATRYLVRASYFEIYNEEVRDLLAGSSISVSGSAAAASDQRRQSQSQRTSSNGGLELKENANGVVYIQDLTWKTVHSVTEILKLLKQGKGRRSVASTKMNATSSRSHSIFSIQIEQSYLDQTGEQQIRVGKLNLVDLAGSERQSKTGAEGDRLKEATKINLSLSALGNVISALVVPASSNKNRHNHVPYRDSKLTRVLQDSLGGNTKTVMCANAGPAEYNHDETLSTLRYASRAKKIQNKPLVNENPKDLLIRQYQAEIASLNQRLMLAEAKEGQMTEATAADTAHPTTAAAQASSHSNVSEEMLRDLQVRADEEMADMEEQSRAQFDKLKEAMKQKSMKEKNKLQETHAKEIEEQHQLWQTTKVAELELGESQLAEGKKVAAEQAATHEAAMIQMEQALTHLQQETEATLTKEIYLQKKSNAELHDTNIELQQTCKSLTEEIKVKTDKLEQLLADQKNDTTKAELEAAKTHLTCLQVEFRQERETMQAEVERYEKQVKLHALMLKHFIPPEALKYFNSVDQEGGQAVWNDTTQEWHLPNLEKAPYGHKHGAGNDRFMFGVAQSAGNGTGQGANNDKENRPLELEQRDDDTGSDSFKTCETMATTERPSTRQRIRVQLPDV
jgi:hypothetical protein